jgi:hypothetical protein
MKDSLAAGDGELTLWQVLAIPLVILPVCAAREGWAALRRRVRVRPS